MILTEVELKNEVWKDIKEYEGLYQVSDMGRIKSIKNNLILKITPKKSGYVDVNLHKNSKIKTFRVHRLVADVFLENNKNKPYVNHINNIKNDNKLINLEYVTPSENGYHSIKFKNINNSKGKKISNIISNIKQIYGNEEIWKPIILNEYDYNNIYKISSKGRIYSISNKKILKHDNFINLYKNKTYKKHSITNILNYVFLNKTIHTSKKNCLPFIYNNKYLISKTGEVISLYSNKYLKPFLRNDYLTVILYEKNNIKKSYFIHQLVAITYIENINKYSVINHINEIKTDNRLENLEWCDIKYNTKHSAKKGTNIYNSKLTDNQVIDIYYRNGKHKDIANEFNISRSVITHIKNKISWKHITKDL